MISIMKSEDAKLSSALPMSLQVEEKIVREGDKPMSKDSPFARKAPLSSKAMIQRRVFRGERRAREQQRAAASNEQAITELSLKGIERARVRKWTDVHLDFLHLAAAGTGVSAEENRTLRKFFRQSGGRTRP